MTYRGYVAGCLEAMPSSTMVIALPDHHILDKDKLASFQAEVRDFGFENILGASVGKRVFCYWDDCWRCRVGPNVGRGDSAALPPGRGDHS